MMKLYKTPGIFKRVYPDFLWKKNTPHLYLTFDDGPHPEITDWVLDLLDDYQIKATFFVLGQQVQKHPHLFKRIVSSEHSLGNHSMTHLKGRQTNATTYIQDVLDCRKIVESSLFRPPYGSITKRQTKALIFKGFKIVMWDLIAYDWVKDQNLDETLHKLISGSERGSIIVFHDSHKAAENLKKILPLYIEKMLSKGFTFSKL